MLKIRRLRDEIGPGCQRVLSCIWTHFLERKEWPSTRLIHSDLGKGFVIDSLKRTNGSVVSETSHGGTFQYQLFGIAPFLTESGLQYELLLLRFFEFLRELYRERPEQRSINNSELEKALHLSQQESTLLCHLIMVSRLYSHSAGHGPEGWTVGVLDDSEDLPDGNLSEALEAITLRSYNPGYAIFYNDQIARSISPHLMETQTHTTSSQPKVPKVFISYSHDSPDHKDWVLELATKLREGGVSIVLDQWHLRLGGEITKFMEDGVAVADRVLLICTEPYTEKVDSRMGGAGYEATVAIAELIESLETTKFIPIIRQKSAKPKVPRGLKSRYHVNLSHAGNYATEFEKLLRELHGIPLNPEPPMGSNPYAPRETPVHTARAIPVKASVVSASLRFDEARRLIQANDRIGWKAQQSRLLRDAIHPLKDLGRTFRDKAIDNDQQQMDYLQEWCDGYQEVMAFSLAAIMSGNPLFSDQSSMVDELLHPQGWPESRHTDFANMPETSVFLFQILHGAACLEMGQIDRALSLACTSFDVPSERKPEKLFLTHSCIGWFQGTCSSPWLFLLRLGKQWPWLSDIFVSEENLLASICAYYACLNLAELAHALSAGTDIHNRDYRFDVPLCYNMVEKSVARRAYRLLSQPGRDISAAWRLFGVDYDQMKGGWSVWKHQCYSWLASVYRHGVLPEQLLHYRLFEDPQHNTN